MAQALTRYRVMAYIVGVLLIPLFICWGLEGLHALDVAMDSMFVWYERADQFAKILGPIHGGLYIVFFAFAVLLSQRARWPLGFTAVTLILGTVPVLSFVGERRATARVRAQMAAEREPETATA